MNTRNKKVFYISIHAMGIALCTVITLFIQISLAGGAGYLNFSDAILLIFSALFGPYSGMVVGGLGALAADLLSGYVQYAPFSLVIKALEGLLVGYLLKKNKIPAILSFLCGGILMALCYFIPDKIYFGFETASYNLIWNGLQGITNAILAYLVYLSVQKIKKTKDKEEKDIS